MMHPILYKSGSKHQEQLRRNTMESLYAPWREQYVTNIKDIKGCVFCHASITNDDDEALGILYKDKHCFVVMNKYPYSPGHFMVIPHSHTENLEDLDPSVWLHMNKLAYSGVRLIKDVVNAQGVNIGINLGVAAGAGIAEHLHLHLVPRWNRDTNFMTSIAKKRVYSSDFSSIYKQMKEKTNQYFLSDDCL